MTLPIRRAPDVDPVAAPSLSPPRADTPTGAVTRRTAIATGAAWAATLALPFAAGTAGAAPAARPTVAAGALRRDAGVLTTRDGTQIHYKDWGSGPAVVFSHGWPLSADAWESQMFFLASSGFRCIAHDRRGHGRSSQPWNGNDMDTCADDLEALLAALRLERVTLVGHSTGGGEVARYIGRHGTRRVSRAVLMGAVPPIMLRTPDNPGGLPMSVFDGFRQAYLADRAQFFLDVASGPFFGFNRPGATVSHGLVQSWWRQGMQSGHKNAFDCIRAFSETDFTADLKRFDVPTLIVHGDDDQIVPIAASALRSRQLVRGAQLKVYEGGSHSLGDTSKDRLNADLLAFLRA